MIRANSNPAFPANWPQRDVDAALGVWSAQASRIRQETNDAFEAMRKEREKAALDRTIAAAALAWCRANGNPHFELLDAETRKALGAVHTVGEG